MTVADWPIDMHLALRAAQFIRQVLSPPGLLAHERSLALLRDWLSRGQLASFEEDGSFEVIGSDTGRRYKIRRGTVLNVDGLDASGAVIERYCFEPAGSLALG